MANPLPMRGLAQRRKARGVSQETAASWIGMTKQGLHRIETGAARLDVVKARQLAKGLSCSVEELF